MNPQASTALNTVEFTLSSMNYQVDDQSVQCTLKQEKITCVIAVIIDILNTEKLHVASYCFHGHILHESKNHLTLLYRYLEFGLPPM